jgi:ABC-type Fe3+-hydroxamate transport system substrate-binding protein
VMGKHRSFADSSKRLAIALGVLFVLFGISAPLTATLWNHDAAYFATWARIPEILAGALLAVIALRTGIPAAVRWLSPLCLTAIVVLSAITPAGRGLAYEGALPLFALISTGLIAGLQHPTVVSRLLSLPPLVFLGRISYGVYLYHWPVFVVLSQGRTELDVVPLSLLRIGVTLAIALVSYFVIEQPIRERRCLTKPRLALTATSFAIPLVALLGITQVSNTSSFEQSTETLPPAAGTLAPLVTLPPTSAPTTTATIPSSTTLVPGEPAASSDSTPAASVAATTTPTPPPTTTIALAPSRPVRILIVGDSTAQVTGVSFVDWAADNPQLGQVEVQAFGGCGILDEGDRFYRGQWEPTSPGCVTLLNEHVPERIVEGQPDIVLVVSSFWDNTDHRWPADPTARSPLDPVYRERALPRFEAYNQLLLDAGAPRVAWLLYPPTDESWDAIDETSDDPARYVAFHQLTRNAAAPFAGQVSTIDLAAWVDEQGLTDDHDARPDGVHFSESESRTIVDTFLANAIIQAALH